MIPLKTIEDLISKHSLLEKELSSGEVDKKLFAEKSKEYADLNEVIDDVKKYFSFESEKIDLEKIINDTENDDEFKIMAENDIDISNQTSNNVNEYLDVDFDLILTVCNNAEENCPYFPSKALRFHYNFPDPSKSVGTEEEILSEFREVRDQIKAYTERFLRVHLHSNKRGFDNYNK